MGLKKKAQGISSIFVQTPRVFLHLIPLNIDQINGKSTKGRNIIRPSFFSFFKGSITTIKAYCQ